MISILTLLVIYSLLLPHNSDIVVQNSHRQHINERAWLCSNDFCKNRQYLNMTCELQFANSVLYH